MKQVTVRIGNQATRVVNANEYSVTPKTNEFKMTANGAECSAWSTSGKGKSAVNNHYLYWKEGKTLFWFKSTAEEIINARTKGFVIEDGDTTAGEPIPFANQNIDGTLDVEVAGGEQPQEAPKARRRVSK